MVTVVTTRGASTENPVGPNPNDFAVILLRWMNDRRFNRKTVAEICRAKERDVIDWERGLGRPSKEQFTRLVRSFSLFGKARMPSDEEIEAAREARRSKPDQSDEFVPAEGSQKDLVLPPAQAKMFGEVLLEFMKEEKLSLKALSELVGCSPSTAQRWVTGKSVPSDDKYRILIDLAPALMGAILPFPESESEPIGKPSIKQAPSEPIAKEASVSDKPVRTEIHVDNARITDKLLAAAKRSPIKLPTMVSQWKGTKRYVHDHVIKRFRQRFLEGTGRGYSNEECVALIDLLVEDAFQLGHFELLRDHTTGNQVMCVGVPGPRLVNQFFGFIVHKNHPSSNFRETIITCLPAQARFNQSEIRVNAPFAGFAERFAEIRKLLPAKVGDLVLPEVTSAPVEEKKPEILPIKSLPSKWNVVEKPPEPLIIEQPKPSALVNPPVDLPAVTQPEILKDPVKAINALVMQDERIGVSTDEAEIAFAYVLARKNLRIQQESLLVAKRLVEELEKKVEEAQAEVSTIHTKLEAL